jgi:hypothetical protein
VASTYTVPNAAVALSASATKSLVLVTPATVDFVLTEISVSFDSATAAQGCQIDLYRVVTIGSAAGTTTTPAKSSNPDGAAATSTAKTNLTTEPTSVTVIKSWFLSPACGCLVLQHPLGREPSGSKTSGLALGLRVTTPSGVTPNALAYMEFEE